MTSTKKLLTNAQWIIADFSTLTHSRISMIILSYLKAAHENRVFLISNIMTSILHEKNITHFLRFFIDKIRLQINFWGGQFRLAINRRLMPTFYVDSKNYLPREIIFTIHIKSRH